MSGSINNRIKIIFAVPKYQNVSVAQLVEQMTLNHRAPGSSPGGDTLKRVGRCPALFFSVVEIK